MSDASLAMCPAVLVSSGVPAVLFHVHSFVGQPAVCLEGPDFLQPPSWLSPVVAYAERLDRAALLLWPHVLECASPHGDSDSSVLWQDLSSIAFEIYPFPLKKRELLALQGHRNLGES